MSGITHGRASLEEPRQFTHWIRLLEGLTRTENVHAWMGQLEANDWIDHITNYHLVAQNESK